MDTTPDIPAIIRSFAPMDDLECKTLFRHCTSRMPDNDTGYDIADIQSAYMKDPGNHFWVALSPDGEIIGMIGVQQHDAGIGEIRRLRVIPALRRRGIGSLLMEAALRFCQERNYLKVKLDTFMDEEAAVRLFEKFRFLHDRTRTLGDKQLMYFYRDLYSLDAR